MLSSELILFMFYYTCHCYTEWINIFESSVPIQYIKFHIYLLVLPIITGLSGLIFFGERANVGPFVVDHLTWLMMTFILTLGFIIQKFSMRYLIGDMHYRKYFPFYINYCICFIGMVKWRLKVNDHVLVQHYLC